MDATLRRKAFAGVAFFLPNGFMEGFAVPHLPLDAKKAGWLFGHLLGVIRRGCFVSVKKGRKGISHADHLSRA